MPHPSAFAQTPEFEPIIEIGEGHTRTQIGELEYRSPTITPRIGISWLVSQV